MKYIPMLFSTEMVRALQNNTKKMTRRMKGVETFNLSPKNWRPVSGFGIIGFENKFGNIFSVEKPYNVGDIIWVRESFDVAKYSDGNIYAYKADFAVNEGVLMKWKPSIHMPKSACRTWLKVTDVRVERLQDISEQDAVDEGILDLWAHLNDGTHAYVRYGVTKKEFDEHGPWYSVADDAIESFMSLWVSINGKESWDINPWVWVVSFEKCGMPDGFV